MPVRISFSAIRPRKHRVPNKRIRQALDRYTEKFMLRVLEDTIFYPPVPAGSRYVRTTKLLRGWRIFNRSTGSGVRWEIVNNVPYAQLVHGTATGAKQWHVHRAHGWKNIGDVMRKHGGREQFRVGAQRIIDGNLEE